MSHNSVPKFWYSLAAMIGTIWAVLVLWIWKSFLAAGLVALFAAGFVLILGSCCLISEDGSDGQ